MESTPGNLLQEVLKRLDVLGTKIGSGAQIGWDTMVKKVYWFDGVILTVVFAALLITIVLVTIRGYTWMSSRTKGTKDQGIEILIPVFGALFTGLCVYNLTYSVAAIFVPEFFAVKQIIEMFR